MYKLLQAKKASGKTFTQIANEVGLTNLYTAQLFHNQVSPFQLITSTVNAMLVSLCHNR